MPEFRPFLGRCKFNDCAHLGEPGCAVIEAAGRGEVSAERLSFYQVLIEQHRELHEEHPEWSRSARRFACTNPAAIRDVSPGDLRPIAWPSLAP